MPPVVGSRASTPSAPAARRRSWVGPVAALVAIGLIAAVVIGVVSSGGDDDDASSSGSGSASTTMPRTQDAILLDRYCDAPGAKWSEVPAYDSAVPSSTHVRFLDEGLDNGSHPDVAFEKGEPGTWGGATAISPDASGEFGVAAAPEVRTVTCVALAGTEPVGTPCEFITGPGSPTVGGDPASAALELAQNRLTVTVYELRTGGVLHKGEVLTPATVCPDSVITEEGQPLGSQVAYGVTQQDVLAWLGSHFVNGKPA